MQVGDKVFIPEYKVFGTINEIQGDRISQVSIETPSGPQIIDTLNLVVKLIKSVNEIIQLAKLMWKSIKEKRKA